jgi:hypothetical protein
LCECASSLCTHRMTAGPHQCLSVKASRESRLQRSASSSITLACSHSGDPICDFRHTSLSFQICNISPPTSTGSHVIRCSLEQRSPVTYPVPAAFLHYISSLRVSDSSVSSAPNLASARWPVTPPARDWTQISDRARTDHSRLERDSPVNNKESDATGTPWRAPLSPRLSQPGFGRAPPPFVG